MTYTKPQKETTLQLKRLNEKVVCKNSVMIERNEVTQAKAHVLELLGGEG